MNENLHKPAFLKPLLLWFATMIISITSVIAIWNYSRYQEDKYKDSQTHYQTYNPRTYYSQNSLKQELIGKKLWVETKNIKSSVPAIAYSHVPKILSEIENSNQLKNIFISIMLPLVLIANHEIQRDKEFIASINKKNRKITEDENKRFQQIVKKYGCEEKDINCMLIRIQPVPVPLAIAQAALESGWGRSRFARQGNALYGQWAGDSTDKTIAAKGNRDGKTIYLRAYDKLLDSVRDYMINLNTHAAYKDFRSHRLPFFKGKTSLQRLSTTLHSYAEKQDYADALSNIILQNNFQSLSQVRLEVGADE